MLGVRVDGVDCRECLSEEVYFNVKEEPSVYKVGVYCGECDYDYGVVTRISRSEIESVDEMFDIGERSVTDFLEQD